MSAPRYHVNPNTGRAGKCEAQKQCRWGLQKEEHFATPAEARTAYERTQQATPAPQRKAKTENSKSPSAGYTPASTVKQLLKDSSPDRVNEFRKMVRLLTHVDYDQLKAERNKIFDKPAIEAAIALHKASTKLDQIRIALHQAGERTRGARTDEQRSAYTQSMARERTKYETASEAYLEARSAAAEFLRKYQEELHWAEASQRMLRGVALDGNHEAVEDSDNLRAASNFVAKLEREGRADRIEVMAADISSGTVEGMLKAAEISKKPDYLEAAQNYALREEEITKASKEFTQAQRMAASAESPTLRLRGEQEAARLSAKLEAAELSRKASHRKLSFFAAEVRDTQKHFQALRDRVDVLERLASPAKR